jgi:intelectin
MLLSLLVMVFAAIDLEQLDSGGVQDLLRTWGLHGSFGKAFETLEIDGMILQDLQEADTTPSDFPRARSFHWKKLRQLIEKNHPRRSLKEAQKKPDAKKPAPQKPVDLTKYKGVSIKKDDAKVEMGEKSDFALYRTGPKAGAIKGDLTIFGNLNVMSDGKVMSLKQFIEANRPKPPPPATCTKYKKANPKFVRGLVQLAGKDKSGTREVYCECSIADGCWTLVASIHEDNVKAKCDKKDKWATTDGGKNPKNIFGTGNWFSNSKFGAAAQATKDDYKSSDYSSLQANDIMIWHVPNDTPASQYFAKSTYQYRTYTGFLGSKGEGSYKGTLAGIYGGKYKPQFKKYPKCYTGLVVPTGPGGDRSFLKGNPSDFFNKEIAPNSKGESQVGYITFTKANNEQGINAMCAGIKYTGCNAEHACIGAGGYLPEGAPKQCSDFSGWDWEGVGTHKGWSASMSLTKSAIFLFVNEKPDMSQYAKSCSDYKKKNPSFQRGIVKLSNGAKLREVYCEATIPDGPWTLVASVHEDNIKAKCDKNDLWATTDGGKNANNKLGTGNWFNGNTFGKASSATKADYKSEDYFKLKASDVMIWHVPNGAAPSEYYSKPKYMYRTYQTFIPSKSTGQYAGTFAGIYADKYKPQFKKYPRCYTGLVVPTGPGGNRAFLRGSPSDFHSKEIAPNSKGESQVGYITFTKANNEQGVNAMCAGIKYTGCNAEHACIGAGGHLPEGAPKQCSDFSGWDWEGVGTHRGWSASMSLTKSAIFILVNDKK